MDEISPLFLHILPTHNDGLSYAEQKVSNHYYNEKYNMSNTAIPKPIQKYCENSACRRCIRIARTMTHGRMPFVKHRHAHSRARKEWNECTDTSRLHPFFSRRQYRQADDDMIDLPRINHVRHVIKQRTDGRMTESGESQKNPQRVLRIGNSRSSCTYVKSQDAHGRTERSAIFSAQRCGDG